jgi:PAS domain S-box-containing protein
MRRYRPALEICGFAGVYACCGWLSLTQAVLNKSASAVWLGTGLALVGLLAYGVRFWPAIFIGAFAVNITTSGHVLGSTGIALGNTVEAVAGAWLVRRYANGPKAFDRTRSIFAYLIFAALLSTLISATIGVLSLCLTGGEHWSRFTTVWLTWWLGDVTSNVIVAPSLILWSVRPFARLTKNQLLEGAGLLLLVSLVGEAVFMEKTPFRGSNYPLEFLAILPLLWAAFRSGERGAVTCSAAMSVIAWYGTRHGLGPFARPDPNESLLLLQTFSATITVTSLVLASILGERYRADQRLKLQDAISRVLAEATTLKEAAPRVLRAICETAEWDFGAFWVRDGEQLRCVDVWHRQSFSAAEFTQRTCEMTFARGEGLPGKTWDTRKPFVLLALSEAAHFPRRPLAEKAGLQSAFGFPLLLGHEVSGVIECFSVEPVEPDAVFVEKLESIGGQLGQFIERKRAEEGLKTGEEMKARLAAIVECSDDAIVGKSLEGIINSWNRGAERVFGYSAAEMVGQSIYKLIPAEKTDEERQILYKIRHGEPVAHFQTTRIHKDGRCIDVSLSVSPIKDATGKIIGASKIARDITHQKQIERALAEAQATLRERAEDLEKRVQQRTHALEETVQSLDGFCYSIAHDLRAPLRALGGFSRELTEEYGQVLDEHGRLYLERIRTSAARMDHLILDLLQYGRLSTADLPVVTVKLAEMFHRALSPLQDEIRKRQAAVRVHEPVLSVAANPVMLEQVLVNLFTNAIKFVPAGVAPEVNVYTDSHDGKVRIRISDNGIGIKQQHIEKLFRPFSRLVGGDEFPGTGIGLAIVRKGVERMGGRVGVESKLGAGSTFWIELPEGVRNAPDAQNNALDSNEDAHAKSRLVPI